MSMSLYRKYRPDIFSLIVGQEDAVSTLTNQLLQNKLSHAYMFIGTRGTGKTSTAKVLAKAVNCNRLKENGDPCNECESCKNVNNSLDIIELDAASNNGVDDIRRIVDDCAYPPSKNKYKVYIIDEVHMLSKGAFNALLKTLEEPPSYVIFILCTTEANKVPATIRSRCIKFEFKRITLDKMIDRMKLICHAEGRIADDGALKLIAVNSDGAMRDALSMLEQAFYLSDNNKITEEDVANMLGSTNIDILVNFVAAMFSMSIKNMLSYLDFLIQNGKDVMILIQEVLRTLRDCMLLKATDGDFIVEGTTEYKNKLMDIIEVIPLETILFVLDTLNDINNKAKYSMNPCLLLQMGLTMMCMPTYSSTEELAAKVKELDGKVASLIDSGKVVTKEVVIEKQVYSARTCDEDAVFVNNNGSVQEFNKEHEKELNKAKEVGGAAFDNSSKKQTDEQPVKEKKEVNNEDINNGQNEEKVNTVKNKSELEVYLDTLKKSDIIFLTLTQNAEIKYKEKTVEIKTSPVFQLPLEEIYKKVFKENGYNLIIG